MTSQTFRDDLAALRPELLRHARRLAGDVDAEDLAQDAIVRALHFEHTYKPGSNLRAWAHRVLQNVVKNHHRRRALGELAVLELEAEEPPRILPGLSPPVVRALASLKPQFRAAVELLDLADLTCEEACQALQIPKGTLLSRVHRGRRALAALLQDPAPGAAS